MSWYANKYIAVYAANTKKNIFKKTLIDYSGYEKLCGYIKKCILLIH